MLCTGLLVKVTWKCRLVRHVAAHLLGAVSFREHVVLCLQAAWAHALQATGRGPSSLLALLHLSAIGLSAAGFAGVISHRTSSRRLSTVIAVPLMKIRTWDQTVKASFCGGKGESAVTAGNKDILYHPCQNYTRGQYYSPIDKNSSFVLSFTLWKLVWVRH